MERIPLPANFDSLSDPEKVNAITERNRLECERAQDADRGKTIQPSRMLGRTDDPFDTSLIDWSKVVVRIAE